MKRSLGPLRLFVGLVLAAGCRCVTPAGFTCDQQYQCPSGYVCEMAGDAGFGHCESSCPAGFALDGGFCLETDAGSADAGSPPAELTYSTTPAVYTVGTEITPNVPTSSGGAVVAYSISPALPHGLTLDSTTGVVSGTPTAVSAQTNYTVTATNSGGQTQATLTLTVNDVAPSSLTYLTNPAIYVLNSEITDNTPSNSGGKVISYSINTPLPTGLSFSTATGEISGTPEEVSAQTNYTVTATNSGGQTQATLTLTVNDVAPSALVYATNPATFTKGVTITSDVPSNSGGMATSYSISASLPTGLSFNTATGAVTGTPEEVSAQANYTVTATNSGGQTQATLTLTVNDVAPSGLTYLTNPAIYVLNSEITDNTPSNSGGTVTSYSIGAALPTGLSFSTATGAVTGTPQVVSAQTNYTVTAKNSGGQTQATLTLTVNDVEPSALIYATNPATFTKGVTITPDTPSNSGGTVTSYSISAPLPTGLSFSTSTGAVTGTPEEVSAQANYTVTATNSGGQTQATLTLTVNDVAPSGLTYLTNPAIYVLNSEITDNTPSNSGGTVTSYSIGAALPTGLSFSTATGAVTGTPQVVSAQTNYTVTAKNSGGQTQATLTLTVNDVEPSALIYATNPATFTKGVTITPDTPSNSGGMVTSYSINTPLPTGLSFSTSTGAVTGTPQVVSAQTNYTVTATNSGGQTQATLTLTVNDVEPSALVYATNPATFTKGVTITSDTPSNSGGTVTSYSINTPLPTGLSFSTSTGAVTGTPEEVSAQTNYTVTATNSGGQTQATLIITVNDVAPTGLTYSPGTAIYTINQQITDNTPSSGGGKVVAYSISTSLPTGLSLDPTTGIISGKPTVVSAQTSYTVTATNSGGSTQAMFSLTVNDVAPSSLTYSPGTSIYTVGTEITDNVPSNSGGMVVSYSVGSTLPGGLSLDTTTGIISGIPTTVTAEATYTVTATNSGGSTQAMFSLTVNDVAPSALTYSMNPAIYSAGRPIPNNTPSNSGGMAVSYSISSSLPTGLSFSTTTGIISGTPSMGSLTASYTVTATNTGGSTQATLTITVVITGVLAAGDYHTCELSMSGGVECWGDNSTGQLGNNSTANSSVPVSVSDLASGSGGAQAVAVGTGHSCALVGGAVECWGDNVDGDLGNNSAVESNVPVQVTGLTSGVQAITSGGDHNCALVSGDVECWGYNGHGELGNNSTAVSGVPVQVTGLTSGVQAISGAGDHTCALLSGAVECWGDNVDGDLGNNSTAESNVPVQVSSLASGAEAIAVGAYHTCALVNGGVVCWGDNEYGQLGNNSTTNSSVPVAVTGLTTGVQVIAAGAYHTCALVSGAVECWGDNVDGDLGNSSTTQSTVPVSVTGLASGVQAIAPGGYHTCALVAGSAECWGDNSDGQLGNNSTTNSSSPVTVSP